MQGSGISDLNKKTKLSDHKAAGLLYFVVKSYVKVKDNRGTCVSLYM